MSQATAELVVSDSTESARVPHSFAFQPVVDTEEQCVYSYEALIRGLKNESAFHVLQQARQGDLHQFDRIGRLKAIELAGRMSLPCRLNLNCLPHSLFNPTEAIEALLTTCRQSGVSPRKITLEVTEEELVEDRKNFAQLLDLYRGAGMEVAIDDFGAGFSGLNLLADYQPDYVKIDMNLVRSIHQDGPRQAIVRAVTQACQDLGIEVVAEGVETLDEYRWFLRQGVHLFQGYLFSKPAFEEFPTAIYPHLF